MNHEQDERNDEQPTSTDRVDLTEIALSVLRLVVAVMLIWTMRNIWAAWEWHQIRGSFPRGEAFSQASATVSYGYDAAD